MHVSAGVNWPDPGGDGRYLPNAVMAGGMNKFIKVRNFLIAKQKTERNIHLTLPDDDAPPAAAPTKTPSRPPPPF